MPLSPPHPQAGHAHRPPLLIEVARADDTIVVHLTGELDVGGCILLENALAQIETYDARRVLIDLDDLTFIDATGLDCLVTAAHRSADTDSRLRLTRGTGAIAATFQLMALDLPMEE